MITIKRFIETTRALLTTPVALAILAALYALLLATLYFFIRVREATVWQVALTLFLLVLIPLEFFVLQSAILQRARTGTFSWGPMIRDAIKLAVVTIPTILLGYAFYYLLNKWQAHYLPPDALTAIPGTKEGPAPLHWPTLLFATLRCFLFGIALPLATIHLWIEISGRDLRATFGSAAAKRFGNAFVRALAFDSVLTYVLGLIVFFLIPYAILFVPHQFKGNKTDFVFFVLRLVLVYGFTLIGWIVTVTTLARAADDEAPASIPVGNVAENPAEAAA
jgi:hypothetical protein